MFHHFQKAWVIYLITSYTVFTCPSPVVSQSASQNGAEGSSSSPTSRSTNASPVQIIMAEPIVQESNIVEVYAEASSPHGSHRGPPRKHGPLPPPRNGRRHPHPHPPPPPSHKKSAPLPKKSIVIKPSKLISSVTVPKSSHRDHKHYDQENIRHRDRDHHQHSHHKNRDRDDMKEKRRDRDAHTEPKHRDSDAHYEHKRDRDRDTHHDDHKRDRDRDTHHEDHNKRDRERDTSREHRHQSVHSPEAAGSVEIPSSLTRGSSKRQKANKDFIEDEFYHPSSLTGGSGPSYFSDEKLPRSSREASAGTSIRGPSGSTSPHSYEEGPPLPFPKPPKTVKLAYYYDSNDGHDLKDLVKNHHLRRRKDCDGLENFVYDLEIIAFFLGVIAAGIGFYADVIPFFNEGVKITYNNDYLETGEGDGIDFPHDYWPIKGNTNAVVHHHPQKRTISIGTIDDNQREVLSVTGEFIGVAGLIISFIGLFPSIVEKFFYSLDWWFGKRGLWKQYLYTYKCEIHPYPKPGWGR